LSRGLREIRVDSSGLIRVTSNHVSLLWQTHEECRVKNCTLVLEGTTPALKKTLEMLDLAELFKVGANAPEYQELKDSQPISIMAPSEFTDTISLDNQGVQKSLQKFIDYLHSLGLPRKTEFALRTVFYEVVINIRGHSGLKESEQAQFAAKTDGHGMKLIFQDKGRQFDPTQFISTHDFAIAARKRQMRGFGIIMIRKLIDKMTYSRKNNELNFLELYKQWSNESG